MPDNGIAEVEQSISPKLLWTLVVTAGFTVGNIYIGQPLLAQIGESFSCGPSVLGLIPALAQFGYVAGLLLVAPLGDVYHPRRLLLIILSLAFLMLVGCACVTDITLFCILSLGVGLTAMPAQIVLAYIATNSSDARLGQNLGAYMSACLVGVLMSRAISGYLAEHLFWRGVYLIWGLIMLALALAVYRLLPRAQPVVMAFNYSALLGSLWTLFKERDSLRSIALTGALMYAALSTFWGSLALYLAGPGFQLSLDRIGAFGLLGVGGALCANVVGRYLDRILVKHLLLMSILAMFASFVCMALFKQSILALILAVVVLDMGAQAGSISNQSEIYRLFHDAQSRLNTIYKMIYFLGGALGSAFSTWAWHNWGWVGVCSTGLCFLFLAALNVSFASSYRPIFCALSPFDSQDKV